MNNSSKTIGFIDLLQIVFIVLKFTNVIAWKWWVVLLPIEIELAFIALALIIYILGEL